MEPGSRSETPESTLTQESTVIVPETPQLSPQPLLRTHTGWTVAFYLLAEITPEVLMHPHRFWDEIFAWTAVDTLERLVVHRVRSSRPQGIGIGHTEMDWFGVWVLEHAEMFEGYTEESLQRWAVDVFLPRIDFWKARTSWREHFNYLSVLSYWLDQDTLERHYFIQHPRDSRIIYWASTPDDSLRLYWIYCKWRWLGVYYGM